MDVELVREWLGHVEADMNGAWSCARGPRAESTRAAYLVQQAAEKLAKAALIACGIEPLRTHDIQHLVALLPETAPHRERFDRLHRFTVFAFAFRYPGEDVTEPEPTSDQIDTWLEEVGALKADIERWLEAREGGAGA